MEIIKHKEVKYEVEEIINFLKKYEIPKGLSINIIDRNTIIAEPEDKKKLSRELRENYDIIKWNE